MMQMELVELVEMEMEMMEMEVTEMKVVETNCGGQGGKWGVGGLARARASRIPQVTFFRR